MAMQEVMRVRCDRSHLEKLERLKQATGLETSALLRRMVEVSAVKNVVFIVDLSKKANSDVPTYQGKHVAVSA